VRGALAGGLVAALLLVLALACSRPGDKDAHDRVFSGAETSAAPAPFDWSRPASALDMDAEEVAARLGSFEWMAAVDWTVERTGDDAQRVHAAESHRVRQFATGEIAVESRIDPGLGKGSETGKEVLYAGGMTYGRALPARFRERPTDHGRDARRYRDETFRVARSVVRLFGGLVWLDAGETSVLGRQARRFGLSLSRDGVPAAAPRPAGAPEPDADTKRRLAFLDGRVPLSLDGEILLDAATGAPLLVRISGALGVASDAKARATIDLLAQVKALGGTVAAVLPPKDPLPDERKPAGVANALETAGLKKAGEARAAREEPADEPVE
jgi:hypothetical protein